MNYKIVPWYFYVIAGLFIYIIFLQECKHPKPCPAVNGKVVKTDTVIVHHRDTVTVNKPLPAKIITKWDTAFIPADQVDTAGVIADYMYKRYYDSTFKTQYGNITIRDSVYQNKLADRKVVFDFKVPEVTKNVVIPPRVQVFTGMSLGFSNAPYFTLGGDLFLKTKSNSLYGVSLSYTSQNSFLYQVHGAWLIHL